MKYTLSERTKIQNGPGAIDGAIFDGARRDIVDRANLLVQYLTAIFDRVLGAGPIWIDVPARVRRVVFDGSLFLPTDTKYFGHVRSPVGSSFPNEWRANHRLTGKGFIFMEHWE